MLELRRLSCLLLGFTVRLIESDETDGRSGAVRKVRLIPHESPSDGEEATETAYYRGIAQIGILILVIGLFLLLVHGCYRVCLSCARLCSGRHCECVEVERGKSFKWRFIVFMLLILIATSLAIVRPARSELLEAVDDLTDGLDLLIKLFEDLNGDVRTMIRSTTTISTTTNQELNCPVDPTDYLHEITDVNSTLVDLGNLFYEALDPLDTFRDKIKKSGKKYVRSFFPILICAPFVLTLAFGFIAVSLAGCCPTVASLQLNIISILTGLIGLPVVLVIFVLIFVTNLVFADVCFLGPASVLISKNPDNEYAAYYLQCSGTNPFANETLTATTGITDLLNYTLVLDDAGCTPTSALDTIDNALNVLDTKIQDVADTALSCTLFQPIVDSIVYKALCDNTVSGLFMTTIALSTSGLATLILLFLTPCARNAFFKIPRGVENTSSNYGKPTAKISPSSDYVPPSKSTKETSDKNTAETTTTEQPTMTTSSTKELEESSTPVTSFLP